MHITSALLAALIGVYGQSALALSADRNDAAVTEIKALEMHLAGLLMQGKVDEYEMYLAADYTRINVNGQVEAKEQVVATFRDSPPVGKMEPTDLDVKVYGDTAILTGHLSITGSKGSRQSRFRKIFIRRNNRWFLVSLQGTALAKP